MSWGPVVRVCDQREEVMVEFARKQNHRPDEESWNEKGRPLWAVQMGFSDLLGRGVKLKLNLHAQFLPDCDMTLKTKSNTAS